MDNWDLSLEQLWRKRVRQHEKSGLTIRKFCEREVLFHHQLAWWRSELKPRDRKGLFGKKKCTKTKRHTVSVADFVPVDVTSSEQSNIAIEVVLDQLIRIAVSPGSDPQVLSDVVRALEQRTC